MMTKAIDVVGKKINRLTGVRYHHTKNKRRYFEFLCDCGKLHVMNISDFLTGSTKSCGCAKTQRLPKEERALNAVLHQYQSNAKTRGLEFFLTDLQFLFLIKSTCVYCGVEPLQVVRLYNRGKKLDYEYLYNGVDRLDNSIGYVEGNCATCCVVCNLAKRDLTKEKFQEWIDRLVKFQNRESGASAPEGNHARISVNTV
jgi:hypothetical protein